MEPQSLIADITTFRDYVVCPLCKTALQWSSSAAECTFCGSRFQRSDDVWDFRVHYPPFLSSVLHTWSHGQEEYEKWNAELPDDYDREVAAIDEVVEIYTREFSLQGRILDVGGHDGRLRHFLGSDAEYVGIDPYPALQDSAKRPNLLRAYPRLREPAKFLRATTEHVPFASELFDHVHMRSVIDHFGDPLLALREARRVLKPGGGLMVGVHVQGGHSSVPEGAAPLVALAKFRKKVRDEGLVTAAKVALGRITNVHRDEHIWHPSYGTLLELVQTCGFNVTKEHWQKPPNDHVVYLLAVKA